MELIDIKKGNWYMIGQYGSKTGIKGKVVDICNDIIVMEFYWGSPFRTRQAVKLERLVGECNRPSLFSNL